MGFIFILSLGFVNDFISHSIIVVDSSSVSTDYVFFYLRLFVMTYTPQIRYVIYGEYRVLNEDDLAWTFDFSPVVCRLYHE